MMIRQNNSGRFRIAYTLAAATAVVMAGLVSSGCSRAYYSMMEKVGYEKRDILQSRVESALKDQEKTQEAFESALEQFSTLVNYDGGSLQKKYDKLSKQYERCESRADALEDRVDSIEDVGKDLFREWESELRDYESRDLRRKSEQRLRQSRQRYETFLAAMRRAVDKTEPVLEAFEDQVLFLKHNLNADVVGSLDTELASLEADVADLIAEMNEALEEARTFLQDFQSAANS